MFGAGLGTLQNMWHITKTGDTLQRTGTRNLQTGTRNHNQEQLLFPSSLLIMNTVRHKINCVPGSGPKELQILDQSLVSKISNITSNKLIYHYTQENQNKIFMR